MGTLLRSFCCILLGLFLFAGNALSAEKKKAEDYKELVFGILPTDSLDTLKKGFEPWVNDLSKKLGIKITPKLGKGTAVFSVPEQPKDQPLTVGTNSAAATVLEPGTFSMTFNQFDVSMEVESGKVKLRRFTDGKTVELSAGQSKEFKPAGPATIEFEL